MAAWIAGNTVMAGAMALVIALVCLLLRPRPALAHALWALVLLRLIAPPLPAPVRVDAIGAARGAAVATAEFASEQYQQAFGDPAADFRRSARKLRITQAQFGAPWTVRTPAARTEGGAAAPEAATVAYREKAPPEALVALAPLPPAPGATLAPALALPASADIGAAQALGWIWAAGSLAITLCIGGRALMFWNVVRRARPADDHLRAAVAAVADRLQMRPPRVRITDRLASPVVWTLGRPTLLWPSESAGASALLQQSSIIAHELAHIRRRDHWMIWLELACTIALWWNPVMWIARRQMRCSAEFACDAWAVANFPAQRRLYAELLIAISERRSCPLGAVALGAVDADRRSFERRLKLIMRGPASYRTPRAAAALVATLSLLAVAPAWSVTAGGAEPEITLRVDPAIADELRPAIEASILARKARRLFELGEWAHAAAAYHLLVQRRPGDGEALSRLGAARLMDGRPAEAIAAFRAQCALNYRRPLGEFNLAAAHARSGDLNEAAQRLAFAVRIGFDDLQMLRSDPDLDPLRATDAYRDAITTIERAAALSAQANEAFDAGDLTKAAAHWAALLEVTPWNTRAIHQLGYCQIRTGACADAIATYGRLLEIGVMVPLASYNTACAAAIAGDHDLALHSLEAAIDAGFRDYKLLTSDEDLAAIRGSAEFDRIQNKLLERVRLAREMQLAAEFGDWAGAETAAAALLQLNPGSGDTWAGLGEARLAQGDAPGAAEAFARQITTGQDVPAGLYSLACALAAQQRPDDALVHLRAAIDAGFDDAPRIESDAALDPLRTNPGFEAVTQSLDDAGVLSKFGAVDWSHLLDRTRRQLHDAPADGRAHLRLGWAHLRLGDYDDAIAAFNEQERLGCAPGIARYNVACALALAGRPSEAIDWLETSLEKGFIDPAHAAADLDLKSLRNHPRFQAFLEKARSIRKVEQGSGMMY